MHAAQVSVSEILEWFAGEINCHSPPPGGKNKIHVAAKFQMRAVLFIDRTPTPKEDEKIK